MNVGLINHKNIPNLDNLMDSKINVVAVSKIEERMCYDSYWCIYTNIAPIMIKMYDGFSNDEMLLKCSKCKTIAELLNIQPKCFYYD